ncbi:hypothetical protein ABMA57_14970 [Saccharospirillum sp. HFRX-1]|uniref:hypothetical protein n=1 Tax=unclassified Saccharospirillum TaxID=2633430 RepID=UPI00371C65CF
MSELSIIEYIWIDGFEPSPGLRSKTRIVALNDALLPTDLPRWTFDGTLTAQADNHDHDCLLAPVRLYPNPLRGTGHYLALCEVLDAGGCTHISNKRAPLRSLLNDANNNLDPWLGFEQPYRLIPKETAHPVPANNKPNYCAVSQRDAVASELAEAHAQACLDAALLFYGMHCESAHNGWRFQIGPRGIEGEACDALKASDDLWIARFLLARLAEQAGLDIQYHFEHRYTHLHTSFSTRYTRDPRCGLDAIQMISHLLSDNRCKQPKNHHSQLDVDQHFSCGITQRTAAIRIPTPVVQQGYGYLVDRRPCADADPYELANYLLDRVLNDDVDEHLDRTA